MSLATTNAVVELIDSELDRLDCLTPQGGTGGYATVIEPTDPEGWVRLIGDDGDTNYYGEATAILSALQSAETSEEDENADAVDRAMTSSEAKSFDISDEPPDDRLDAWKNSHEFAGMALVGEGNEELGLVVRRTNGSLLYGFAPTSTDYSAFGTTHDYSQFYPTAQEAADAAGEDARAND